MKLKSKINVFSTLLTTIILVASFTGIYFLYKHLAFETEYDQLQKRADELIGAVSQLDSVEGIEPLLRAYIPPSGLLRVVKDEQYLLNIQATSSVEKIPFVLDEDEPYTISSWQNIPMIATAYPLIWPTDEIVTLQLVQPLPDIAQNMEILKWILIVMTIIAILPIYLASTVLARILVTPIQQLTNTMHHNIATNRYEQLPQPTSKDEIAVMTSAYNALMTKLEENYTKQQQFVGNASHELKTPLTVIESYAKLLERRGLQNEQVVYEALAAITKETANMKNMIAQMLQLASVSENNKINKKPVAMIPLLQEIATSMQQAYSREVKIIGENITLQTDEAKLKQLLYIFLDNARKYSDEPIEVKVLANNGFIKILITDFGVGIPEQDLPHLFERFYRVDKDRNRKTGGTGLGLSIARQLSDLLGADVSIASTVNVGTTITLTLKEASNE
ncbi:HAMP domain-containing sensor histidine kinase [Solibacillus sp. CAU 1738]|uniref:sensor histidine kinase n=1 Tax=Solibacillus sp. CAU 1738 TaxID=3140363 RepID=UPI003260FB8B